MASVVCQKPAQDYFTLSTPRPQQNTFSTSPFVWDSSPYELPSPESCDSILPSPTSPTFAYPAAPYALPKGEDSKDQIFNFGTFDDWMGWDDPADNALSPTSDFFPELKLEPMSPNLNSLSPGNPIEDAAVFGGGEPAGEEPLFQTPKQNPSQLPESRENLYSTPLSWTRPASGSRRTTYISNGVTHSQEELAQLRNIAMPPTNNNYLNSPSSASSPEPHDNRRKRKSSVEDDDEDDSPPPPTNGRHPPIKKTAHNMIEKRYRTNLNDKIAALRDSVPALRVVTKKGSRGEGIDAGEEDLQGLTPAHKLNKATVLSKATEYIAHLEKRNKSLNKENGTLKSRVDAFEILMMARQAPNGAPRANSRPQQSTAQRGWSQ